MKKITMFSFAVSLSSLSFSQNQNANPSAVWNLNGNTINGSASLGTNNSSDMLFKTNNLIRGRLSAQGHLLIEGGGKMGINLPLSAGLIPQFMLEVNGDGKFTGPLNVERHLIVQDYVKTLTEFHGRSIHVDTVHMGPGKLVHGDGEWNGNLVVRKDLTVMETSNFTGDATVGGLLNIDKSITFGGASKISYFPATATTPPAYVFGSGINDLSGGPESNDGPCQTIIDPTTQQFVYNGKIISKGMYTSYGFQGNTTNLNRMDMGYDGANGIIDVSGTSTAFTNANHSPALLINWYCGKDVYMCTGSNGGTVAAGKTFEVGIPTRDLNTAVNIKAEKEVGIKLDATNASNAGQITTVKSDAIHAYTVINASPGNKSNFSTFNVDGDGTTTIAKPVSSAEPIAFRIRNDDGANIIDAFTVNRDGTTLINIASGAANVNAFDIVDNSTGKSNFRIKRTGTIYMREGYAKSTPFPDYVFKPGYKLKTLAETKEFIKQNGHLHGVMSAEEVEKEGIPLGEMARENMEKTEEIFLHLFEMEEKINGVISENKNLKKENEELKKRISILEEEKK